MKAKVIKTGKIIDVVSIPDRSGGLESYWDSKNEKEYFRFELDFNIDTQMRGVQMNDETVKPIDLEQRRYEIAKAAMVGELAFPVIEGVNPNPTATEICKWSVKLADALIEELKKTGE